MRGPDLETEVRLSFEDSLRGAEAKIPVEVTVACSDCGGTGAQPRHGTRHLPAVQRPRRHLREPGPLRALAAVPALPRQRHRDREAVLEVQGLGRERRLRNYTVKIKPGVKDGTKIRLKGKGEAGANGGPNGDLVVITRVAPSDTYERRGDDLLVQVPVAFATAALGGKVDVPTPDGAVSLKIPAGSEDGKLLRIKGRGAPKLQGSGKGDVLARVRIQVPKRMNKKERELLEELRKAGG